MMASLPKSKTLEREWGKEPRMRGKGRGNLRSREDKKCTYAFDR